MTEINLSCDAFQGLLQDYLEGSLDDSGAAGAELHLAACASCRALVKDLQAISASASALPTLAPSQDLWAGIESRIAPKVLPLAAPTHRNRSTWRLGAVAAALVAATALTTWTIARRDIAPPASVAATPSVAPVAPLVAPAPAPSAVATQPEVVPVREATPRVRLGARDTYTAEIIRLRSTLNERSDVLDPATVAIIEASLATIDTAIAQARGALAKDPGSRFLSEQLNKSLERKLGLLRTATLLPSTT